MQNEVEIPRLKFVHCSYNNGYMVSIQLEFDSGISSPRFPNVAFGAADEMGRSNLRSQEVPDCAFTIEMKVQKHTVRKTNAGN